MSGRNAAAFAGVWILCWSGTWHDSSCKNSMSCPVIVSVTFRLWPCLGVVVASTLVRDVLIMHSWCGDWLCGYRVGWLALHLEVHLFATGLLTPLLFFLTKKTPSCLGESAHHVCLASIGTRLRPQQTLPRVLYLFHRVALLRLLIKMDRHLTKPCARRFSSKLSFSASDTTTVVVGLLLQHKPHHYPHQDSKRKIITLKITVHHGRVRAN